MAMGAVVARILTQYSDKGSKAAQKDIAKLAKKFDDFGKKARKSFALAITASATLAVKIGTDSVQAAIEDSKSQLVLAQAMKNTTGATQEAIKAAEDYISKTQYLVNVADDLLRPSLAQLYIATGNLADAQRLQTIALDVSAASGKDLATTTIAIAKAQQGNVAAIKKLSPELSGLIGKTTNAEQAFALLEATYGGSAQALADLDPLTKLKLAYGDILETLGYELLPVVKEFATYLINEVVPAVQEWIKANGDKLRTAIRDIVDGVIALSGTFATFAKFIKDNEFLIKLAINLFAIGRGAKVAGKFMSKMDEVLSKGIGLFKGIRSAAGKATDKMWDFLKTSESGLMGRIIQGLGWIAEKIGAIIGGFLLAKAATQTVTDGISRLLGLNDKNAKSIAKTTNYTNDISTQMYSSAMAAQAAQNVAADKAKAAAAARAAAAKAAAAEAAAAAKTAAETARTAKAEKLRADVLARLKKLQQVPGTGKAKINGVVPTSTLEQAEQEAISFRAAELLLIKQKDNAEELKRLKALQDRIEYQKLVNELSLRYVDILRVLGDQKITDAEIKALALGWKLPEEAVRAYLIQFQAVADGTISTDEITNLAKAWGSTEQQAAQYLDFLNYLNDGILSDAEIEKLKSKWKLTEDQVRMYADFVQVVNDGKLNDSEVVNLQAKWKLSIDEVVAYIKKIGSPVTYSGTLIDPAKAAELGWKSATAALEAYLALLAKGTNTTVVPKVVTPPVVTPPVITTPPPSGDNVYDALQRFKAKEAADAAADAAAKAATDAAIAAAAANPNVPNYYASQESGMLGAASIAAKQAEAARLAALAKQEAQAQAYAEGMAARYGGFVSTASTGVASAGSTISTASTGGSPTINITVQGSVTSEQDLVATVRNGLLNSQYNGKSILLETI